MQTVTIPEIVERLQKLSADKLVVVYDFVSYLFEREMEQALEHNIGSFSDHAGFRVCSKA